MLGKVELAKAFGPGSHGTTFGGNNLAMRVAETVITEINQPTFLSAVAAKGNFLKQELSQLIDQSDKVCAVRGAGLMIGVELDSPETLYTVIQGLKNQQLLALKAGKKVLRLLPPLTISQQELEQGLKIIRQVIQ